MPEKDHPHPGARVPSALAHPQGHIHCLLESQKCPVIPILTIALKGGHHGPYHKRQTQALR